MPRGVYDHYKIKGLHPKGEFKKGSKGEMRNVVAHIKN